MTQTQLHAESQWLLYARSVFSNLEHRDKCLKAGGALPPQPGPYNELRWPGYLGENYGGVLCLGMIHNGDMLYAGRTVAAAARSAADDLKKSILDLEPVAISWFHRQATDQTYLDKTRDTYMRALPHWDPWKRLFPILKHFQYALRPALASIAYANIAKCWSNTADATRNDEKVMSCCNEWLTGSTYALIHAIRPLCILVGTTRSGIVKGGLPLLSDGMPPDVWSFDGRQGTVTVNGLRQLRDTWAPRAAATYFKRRAAGCS